MTRQEGRRGATEIIVFGLHPVREALRSANAEVHALRHVKARGPEALRALLGEARAAGVDVEAVSRSALDRYGGAGRHDQGVVAKVRLRRVIEVETFVESVKGRAAGRPLRLLALDGVTNSQNVGMVVRSVVGAGLDGLLWPRIGQPWVNGLVVRAASGSIFDCPILLCESLPVGLAALQAAGFTCIGLDAQADAPLFGSEPPRRAVFVLGSESRGLSDDVAGMLDRRVSIPMAGPVESLNVAVAAGLVCFHAAGLLRSEAARTEVS
jgi:23S rRNA (guanosine2251-2'-O)-methyltransferase